MVGYLISSILSAALILPSVLEMMDALTAVSNPSAIPPDLTATMAISTAVSVCCGIFFWGLLGMATGAFGGWVSDNLTKDEDDEYTTGDALA